MNKRKLTAKKILTVLSVIAVGAIFFNSSLDAETSTTQSDPLTAWINQFFASINIHITITDKMVRKAAHFSEYAVLGALLSATIYLYVGKRKETFMMALPLGCAVAVCDEVIQLRGNFILGADRSTDIVFDRKTQGKKGRERK